MNKYTELSDFEINRRIAEMDTKNRYVYFEKEQTIFRKFNNGQTQKFNPCNYPTDAMPIIIENEISMIKSSGGWMCCHGSVGNVERESLYRGAMEVFLMIKEAENEG
ncbi:phage protein NinX family protein [Proteus penneri]|uniref:phage protein NinX family protein n=1 Tax=Proteus penneri TaxID=102862 RepID=UPI00288C1B4A|nr:phage protein NinX family protein [Proteus penneri]